MFFRHTLGLLSYSYNLVKMMSVLCVCVCVCVGMLTTVSQIVTLHTETCNLLTGTNLQLFHLFFFISG